MISKLFLFLALGSGAFAQAPEWGQCGGIGWNGPTACPSGWTCVFLNAYHSQCLQITTTEGPTTTTTTTTTAPSTTVIDHPAPEWGQCGGIGWSGPTVCVPGWTCVYDNPYHSQCLLVTTTDGPTTITTTTAT